jgi:hypothetical protein
MTARNNGRASNVWLVVFVFLLLGGGAVLLVASLVDLAMKKPGLPALIVLAIYSAIPGCLIGAYLFAMRRRVFWLHWDDEGLTFRAGWRKPIAGRWWWSDPIRARLFAGQADAKGPRGFVLVVRVGHHEIKVDSFQCFWKTIRPFVEELRRRSLLEEADYDVQLIEQAPSLRLDPFALPAPTGHTEASTPHEVRVPSAQRQLLREMIAKCAPDLLPRFSSTGDLSISSEEADRLQQSLCDELLRDGLMENDEPNEYGLKIEDLIDVVGRAHWPDKTPEERKRRPPPRPARGD